MRSNTAMKLHGAIALDRPLLVVALEEEAQHLHVSELPILVTGVGKICAAAALSSVLARQRPSRLVNLGTAGALRGGLSGTHVIGRVIQHDFDDEVIFALAGKHFGAPIRNAFGNPSACPAFEACRPKRPSRNRLQPTAK